MDEFDIPVQYKGKEYTFSSRLLPTGWTYRIEIDMNGHQLFIEKDDEGNFRAILADPNAQNKIEKGLVEAIVEALQELLK